MPIATRLALGFLIPALLAALALGSIELRSQQRLSFESQLYQLLTNSYTSLNAEKTTIQQLHANALGILNEASKLQPEPIIIRQDRYTLDSLATQFELTLASYAQRNVLVRSASLSTLFTEAGHAAQVQQQFQLWKQVELAWFPYRQAQQNVLDELDAGNLPRAQALELQQVEPAYAALMGTLLRLLQFTDSLAPAIHDAQVYEENLLTQEIIKAALYIILGIGIVGWLVFSTLVRRLQRARQAMHVIEGGQINTRLSVVGRDEISGVCGAVNGMLDTIVGLLEETRQQRDELAKGEELKHLHEELQSEQEALQEANGRLAALATTDVLTNLPNHRALQNLLEQECERSRRFGHPLSVLFFDGDRFKLVNDTYGHAVGDVVLRELGERARSELRAGDTVGRFGGEEFLVLLPETGEQEARRVAERLRRGVAASPLAAREVEGGIAITVSIGLASFPSDGATASELREQADQAMYWAKRLGRNQVRTAAEAQRANCDATLKAATAHALERPELAALDGRDPERMVRAEQLSLIYSLMGALDLREPGMSTHAHEVGDLVAGMARALRFDEESTRRASTAAFLHDIGKIALPDRLLYQPRQHFSAQEWRLLHQHAELGAGIVEASHWLSDLAPAIRHHHERWDGTGDPDGLAGEDIPLEARMIAVAEAYHAMITDQPYQAARSVGDALAELERRAGAQFDPALLPVFRAVLESRGEPVELYSPIAS